MNLRPSFYLYIGKIIFSKLFNNRRISEDGIYLIYHGKICSKSILESKFCYVVDSESEVFLWQGKSAPAQARTHSNQYITVNNSTMFDNITIYIV